MTSDSRPSQLANEKQSCKRHLIHIDFEKEKKYNSQISNTNLMKENLIIIELKPINQTKLKRKERFNTKEKFERIIHKICNIKKVKKQNQMRYNVLLKHTELNLIIFQRIS